MGNCGLKPKVLSKTGAPVPEELKDSLLEYHKIDAAKSLSNLFLQEKVETKTKDVEKITVEDIVVSEDLQTALVEENTLTKEAKSPTKVITSPVVTETKYPVTEKKDKADEKTTPVNEDLKTIMEETKAQVDDQMTKNEETVDEEKVIEVVMMKETETEAKAEEVRRDAAQ